MKRLAGLVAATLLALSVSILAQAPPAAGQGGATFKTGVELVSLNVTVTDSGGRYLSDLDQADFSVFEDGAKQEITFFTRRIQPVALSLLLDTSASMDDKLATLQTAASNFVGRLKPTDVAQVIDFDSRVEIRQTFTSNQADLLAAINKTAAGGSTSLHNAIYIALKELKKIKVQSEEDVRRQAIVVFSDGEDTSSLVSFDEVLDLAKRQRDGDLHDRAARTGHSAQRLPRSRVRHAPAG